MKTLGLHFTMRGLRRHALLGALVAATMFLVPPVLAGPHHKHGKRHGHRADHHRHGWKHHDHRAYRHHDGYHAPSYRGHGRHARAFSIPSVIHRSRFDDYRPYYHGRAYYRPHRHHHAVYHFPVYRDHGYAYEPFAYCDGRLYGARGYVSYDGPRFGLRVGF